MGVPALLAVAGAQPAAAASSPSTTGCILTPTDFANAFLGAINEPDTPANVAVMVAWEQMEGGNWNNTAKFNPLNTTRIYDGSQPFYPGAAAANNGFAVQAYNSWADGVQANVLSITNGLYGSILTALSQGTGTTASQEYSEEMATATAIDNSPWGTKNVTSDISSSGLPPAYDPPTPSWEPRCGGAVLQAGFSMSSPNGYFTLIMQGDGNLVEYAGTRAVWQAGTVGNTGAWAAVQTDGNLVVYSPSYVPLWQAGTGGHSPSRSYQLQLPNSGQLTIGGPSGTLWSDQVQASTFTSVQEIPPGWELVSPSGQYEMVMQTDGNLVEYEGSTPLWYTNTHGDNGAWAVIQSDGNFVVYSPSYVPLWQAGTGGRSGSFRLVMQDDGNLVDYQGYTPLWWTKGR